MYRTLGGLQAHEQRGILARRGKVRRLIADGRAAAHARLFSDPTSNGSPLARLNYILGYFHNSSCLPGPQTGLQRHGSVDLYGPQPFPAHGLEGLFSTLKVRLSNSISPFRQNPSLETPGLCLTLRNNHGPMTRMLQTSHAEYISTRRPILLGFSLAPFSMVRPVRLTYSPVYRAHFVRSDRSRDYNHAVLPMYGRVI